MEMADRMRGGRWRVFEGDNDTWLEEYRLSHRDENGRVVAENDDAISASRYGLMMRRHARAAGIPHSERYDIVTKMPPSAISTPRPSGAAPITEPMSIRPPQ